MSSDAARKPSRSLRGLAFRLAVFVFFLILLLGVAGGIGGFLVYDYVTSAGGAGGIPVRVTIPPGANGRAVGTILAQYDLIEHEALFRLAMRLDDAPRPLKHGPYLIPRGASPTDILRLLQEGPNRPLEPEELGSDLIVTIAEGLTLRQIAPKFENPDAFLEAASDSVLIERLGIDAPTLEGFLMPNTYYFAEKPAERQVVARMVEQFETDYVELIETLDSAPAYNKLELVTIASLIEEETRLDEERPLVSAVIHNRLAKNMRLELDSTLQYALGKYGQRLLNDDKDIDSPYNTYKHAGLPPGPISNPGAASLQAALTPADADYLYFVSNADGRTHTFSSTFAEHSRAVARFRREIAEQRRNQRNETSADQ